LRHVFGFEMIPLSDECVWLGGPHERDDGPQRPRCHPVNVRQRWRLFVSTAAATRR
jgi:hypothetical protein